MAAVRVASEHVWPLDQGSGEIRGLRESLEPAGIGLTAFVSAASLM